MPSFGKGLKQECTRLWHDERGAALMEYTLLVSIMIVGVIALVVLVAGWMGDFWSGFHSILNPKVD